MASPLMRSRFALAGGNLLNRKDLYELYKSLPQHTAGFPVTKKVANISGIKYGVKLQVALNSLIHSGVINKLDDRESVTCKEGQASDKLENKTSRTSWTLQEAVDELYARGIDSRLAWHSGILRYGGTRKMSAGIKGDIDPLMALPPITFDSFVFIAQTLKVAALEHSK